MQEDSQKAPPTALISKMGAGVSKAAFGGGSEEHVRCAAGALGAVAAGLPTLRLDVLSGEDVLDDRLDPRGGLAL